MAIHWLLRIGDGDHFASSSKMNIWGVNSKTSGSSFVKEAKQNDILWFVKGKSKGQVIAVATLERFVKRELGPLINLTHTNEELGWTKQYGDWDYEVHFTNMYNIESCSLLTEIKSPLVIRKYDSEKCKVNLPLEYQYIVKYVGVANKI